MSSDKQALETSTSVTVNPIVGGSATMATSPSSPRSAPAARSNTLRIALVVLALTNIAAIAVAVTFAVKYHDETNSSSERASTTAMFSANHPTAEPAVRTLSNSRSTTHMQRSHVSYKGTEREGKTLAAGVTRIVNPETGVEEFDVHTEIYNDGHFGEYAGANGAVGDRSLRLRVRDLASGEEVILVPHSLSLATLANATLIPNMYFFSHKAGPDATPTATHLSTLVPGRVVLQHDIGRNEYSSFMPRFFKAYEAAWVADHPAATRRRRLGFGSWAAGKVGGWIGGRVGGDAGADIGADAAKGLYGGDSVGQAVGGAVGGYVGKDIGSAVGEDVGAAAGGALGTAIGGPIGGFVGEEVGGWAGKEIGGDIGQDVGSDLGSHFGQGIENDVKSWF